MKFGRQRRGGMRKKEQATCIAEHHYLIVRQPDDSSEQDQENWALFGKDKFDKMRVFLGWENSQRTNNHVERNPQVLRIYHTLARSSTPMPLAG